MWIASTVFLLLVAVVLLSFFWQRKLAECRAVARAKLQSLGEQHSRELAELRARQDALFNSMAEGFVLMDTNGRIRLSNRAFSDLFDIDTDPHGKLLLEIVRLHELADLAARLEREDRVLGCELHHRGVRDRFVEVNAVAVKDPTGERCGMVLVFHDLTRIKRLEKSSADLIANVSHELRTPVSIIKGYVETLLSGAKDDPAALNRFLQTIERHSNRLALLIEDLLTSSEFESGRAALILGPVQLRRVVDRVIEELEPRARERGVTLLNNLRDLTAMGDSDRLEQVFANLVDNAIKYGRPQGVVTVGAQPLDDDRVQVHVSDDGPGLPPEALPRVFERFYRLDKARSREHGGTGLGLSIVRHIVRAHGGEVWVESQPGRGATFYFTLQRRAQKPVANMEQE